MKNLESYEIIIIGAGLSGLSLAKEISTRSNYKILILEKKERFKYDKNWCFWNIPKNPFTDKYDTAWNKVSIIIDEKEKILHDKNIKYLHIKSSSFYRQLINDLKKKDVKIKMNQQIEKLFFENDFKLIKTNDSVYKSRIVFDSRPKKHEGKNKPLYQHFYGAEIIFEKSILDKDKVILMDFQKFSNGVNFFYILPFSSKKALFETTYFSKNVLNESSYKSDIRKYIKKKFPNQKYKFKFMEKGKIPMFHTKNVHNTVVPIGTRGNWVRASTGYAFQNSFINAKEITDKLLQKKRLSINGSIIIAFLDRVFCYYISNYSTDSKIFFKCFFMKNKFKDIVNFLVGKINFFTLLKIIFSLPKKKLFFSMLKSIK